MFELRNLIGDTFKLERVHLASSESGYKRNFDKKGRMRTLEVGNQVLVLLPTDHNNIYPNLPRKHAEEILDKD